MANETYPYAYTDEGNIIYIDDVNENNRRSTHYHCYGCGKELFPVLGDKRAHHFRHEKDSECDPNRYLHEYAKKVLKKRFDEGESFTVSYPAHQTCKRKDKCSLIEKCNWNNCERDGLYQLDLKKYYDTCTLEKGYYEDTEEGKKRYVADLKLSSTQFPKRKSVTLEIWVTHKCTEEKLNSGAKIIEIKIEKEKDAHREIIASDGELPIGFYGFSDRVEIEDYGTLRHYIWRRGLDGKTIVVDDSLCCEEIHFDKKGFYEVVFPLIEEHKKQQFDLFYFLSAKHGYGMPSYDICKKGYSRGNSWYCQLRRRQCPCPNFSWDIKKTDSFIEQLKDITYWDSNDIPTN